DAAWDQLYPSLTATVQAVDALCNRAGSLGLSLDAECAELRAAADALRQRVERDPLGALHTSTTDLEPRLDRLRSQINAFEQTRASVLADLTRADGMLDELRVKNVAIVEAQRRCAAEIRSTGEFHP